MTRLLRIYFRFYFQAENSRDTENQYHETQIAGLWAYDQVIFKG